MTKRSFLWLSGGILALIPALLIYRKVLDLGLFADDFVLLEMLHQKNSFDFFRSFTSIVNDTRSRPVVSLLYLLEGGLGIADGKLPHLSNILLHLLNAGLLIYWIKLLTRNLGAGIFAGILFWCHPIQPEAVFWITGRFDPVCFTFFLLTLIFYLKDLERPSIKYLIAIFGFALLCFFSKETGLMAIGVAVGMDLVKLWERDRGESGKQSPSPLRRREILRRWAILAGLVVIYVLLRVFFTGSLIPEEVSGQMRGADFSDRLSISLDHLLIPIWHPDQSHPWIFWALIIIPAAAVLLNFYRPARFRYLLIGLALLIFSLIPALGSPVEMKDYVSSRFLYIPSAGLAMTLALLLTDFKKPNFLTRLIGAIAGISLILVYLIQLNKNIIPFQQGQEMISKVIPTMAFAGAPSGRRSDIYLMNFPRSKNGVMLFSRDLALSSALNLAAKHQIKFGPEAGLVTGPLARAKKNNLRQVPSLKAYHIGRLSSGEYIFHFPDSTGLVSGQAAIYRWDDRSGRLVDLTDAMIRAVIQRGQELKESSGRLETLDLVKAGNPEPLFLKNQLVFDPDRKIFQALGPDPFLETMDLSLDPLLVDKIVIQMSLFPSAPGQKISAQLFWRDTGSEGFTEPASVIFPVQGDGRSHSYPIPLHLNPDFVLSRPIVRFRFDPMDSPGTLQLDSFQIVPFRRE